MTGPNSTGRDLIRRLRLVFVVARPAVAMLLAMYAALGLAQAGDPRDWRRLVPVLVVVCAFLLFSVVCNDLADLEIDRVNLPGDRRKPLVTGLGRRGEVLTIGLSAAGLALAVSALLGWPLLVVTSAGLVLSAAYSTRPVRVADRGALAALLLPACYVAVPYLLGFLSTGRTPGGRDLLVLAGLYVTFLGRILLKDFRDVRGDALFGKRTVLVRHGRRVTCAISAAGMTVGTGVLLLGVNRPSVTLIGACALGVIGILVLLRELAADPGHRREELCISAIAIIGRGMLLVLLAFLTLRAAGWPAAGTSLVLAGLAAIMAAQAVLMRRHGPTAGLRTIAIPTTESTTESTAESITE